MFQFYWHWKNQQQEHYHRLNPMYKEDGKTPKPVSYVYLDMGENSVDLNNENEVLEGKNKISKSDLLDGIEPKESKIKSVNPALLMLQQQNQTLNNQR